MAQDDTGEMTAEVFLEQRRRLEQEVKDVQACLDNAQALALLEDAEFEARKRCEESKQYPDINVQVDSEGNFLSRKDVRLAQVANHLEEQSHVKVRHH